MKRILACILLLLCLPALAGAASFEIADHTMDIQIEEDGAGTITETLLYTFGDSYNGIFIKLGYADGLSISELSLVVDGNIPLTEVDALDGVPYTYTITPEKDSLTIQAYTPGGKGDRSFQVHYRLGGLARRYLDTARINHVLVHSETALENSTIRVHLPQADESQVLAYVHGAMGTDNLHIAGGIITLGPAPIAENGKLELDVLFPAEWLPAATTIQSPMREEALATEAEIAAEASAKAERDARLARIFSIAAMVALLVYLVVSLLIFMRMRSKYGMKHPILPTTDDGLLNGMTAAEAQLLKDGSVSSSGLTATLMELSEMGVLTMADADGDTSFTIQPHGLQLAPHQAMLINWLFTDNDTFLVSQLDAGEDVAAATAFTNQYNAWKRQVLEDVFTRGWRYRNDGARTGAALAVLFIGLAISFFLVRAGLWPLGVPGAVLSILLCILFTRIRRLTDTGESQLAAINGFLANYADKLETAPQTVLSHAPLVMALGYMEPLATWIDSQSDIYAQDDAIPIWMYVGWHHSALRMDETIRDAQSHNAGTQSTGDSSSSGSGFSGGSGGGNSYGAW